jgi:integrase/recombinase XerD
VTQLRKKMLEELQRRNYSHRTAKTYVRIVRDFAEHFHQPPDKLGPEQIRQYQAHLFQAKKFGSCHGQSVCVRVALLVHQDTAPALSG